jgi:hypothetical protein
MAELAGKMALATAVERQNVNVMHADVQCAFVLDVRTK